MSDGDVRNFRKFIHLSEFGSREHDHIASCAGGGWQKQYVVEGDVKTQPTLVLRICRFCPSRSRQRPWQGNLRDMKYQVKDWPSGGCSGCRPCAPALTTSSKGHLGGSPHRSLQRYKAVIWSELRLLLQRLPWGEPIIGHHLALQPKQSQLWDAILLWWQCWRASLQHREHWWDQWYIRQNGLMLLWAHFAMLGFQKHLVQIPLPHTTLSFGMCKFFLHNKVVQCKDTFCSLHLIFTTAKYLN